MRTDPRIRQSLNRISTSLESASDNALTSCFTFTKSYLDPCLASLSQCCIRDRQSGRGSGRSEYPFGFYDYDDSDEDSHLGRSSGGFLAWGNDELDRLLAGGGGGYGGAPNRMYYGGAPGSSSSTGGAGGSAAIGKRKTGVQHEQDPTVIPRTTVFGFLARFAPFRGKGLRYKPSAANLQEHPQRGTGLATVQEDDVDSVTGADMRRQRTNSSGDSIGGSLRSRGDLWPSEDDDDAIPIGDDVFLRGSDGEGDGFLILRRRDDDEGSDTTIGPRGRSRGRPRSGPVDDEVLRREEEEARIAEEAEVEMKREAARRLAVHRGLSADDLVRFLRYWVFGFQLLT
ncbi:hypothetical protein Q9L58_007891 [Maublancomyces gigas]|uniref:Uncharacterized protein n=1 Tax=Discina gigas TaxID=1032678 RepID=A0ABR3GBX5_9PEZI